MPSIVPPPGRSGIYLSYRPEDSYGHAQALITALKKHFGHRLLADPDDRIANTSLLDTPSLLESYGVVLAIIGRHWLGDPATPSERFLSDPTDSLRRVLAAALTDHEILVIPILVAGASVPEAADLPANLQQLPLRTMTHLRGSHWNADVEKLIHLVEAAAPATVNPVIPSPEGSAPTIDAVNESWGLESSDVAVDLDVVEGVRTRRIAEYLQLARLQLAAEDYDTALSTAEEVLLLNPFHSTARNLAERARAARARTRIDENVQFTVYRRSIVRPGRWYPLLAFAHLAERRPDSSDEEPDPVREVQSQARQVLGESAGAFQALTSDSRSGVMREGELRFVPQVNGVEFNPSERRFIWSESVHREEFRMRATKAIDGSIARGVLTVYAGNLLLADVPLMIKVDENAREAHEERSEARPYRRIFASYSHRDQSIVEEFEGHAKATGDRYLRDVITLRAGERWSDQLIKMIDEADVFQLFWSWNALASPMVQKEWEYALELGRTSFVRPVYWEEPLPERSGLPTEALRRLHFQRVYPRLASGGSRSQPEESDVILSRSPVPHPPLGMRPPNASASPGSRHAPPVRPKTPNVKVGRAGGPPQHLPMTRVLRWAAVAAPLLAVTVYLSTMSRSTAPPPPASSTAGPPPVASTPNNSPSTSAQEPSPPASPPKTPPQPVPPVSAPITSSGPTVSKRAQGISGVISNDLTVRGILERQGEFVALVQTQDGTSFSLRKGDRLFDGTVKAINTEGVVIIQEVSDPLSLEKQREVIKRVRPR